MKNSTMIKSLSVVVAALLSASVSAAPITLSSAQMDSVAGGAFVCPVLSTNAASNSPKYAEPEPGLYTIIATAPGSMTVPMTATNDDGAGAPHGDYVSPGDTTYTAIWY